MTLLSLTDDKVTNLISHRTFTSNLIPDIVIKNKSAKVLPIIQCLMLDSISETKL